MPEHKRIEESIKYRIQHKRENEFVREVNKTRKYGVQEGIIASENIWSVITKRQTLCIVRTSCGRKGSQYFDPS